MGNPPKIDPKMDPKIEPQAWQDYQDGLERYRLFTKTDNEEARKRFESAIRRQSEAFRREPDRWQAEFPRAYALLSATHRQDWILAWSGVDEAALRASQKLAQEKANDAIRLASGPPAQPSLAQAYLQRGFVNLYAKRLSDAAADAEKVISLSPDSADGYALAAHVLIYQGKPEEALQKMQPKPTAAQDPKYTYNYYYYQGHAYYVWGFQTTDNDQLREERFKEAKGYLDKALSKGDKGPNFRPARSYLVATLSELGLKREAVDEMIKVRSTGGRPSSLQNPQELEKFIKRTLHYENPKITERLIKLWQEAEQGAKERTGPKP